MAKKGSKLRLEINSDSDWEEFLLRKGLLVVEIYSTWSGPCNAMLSTLRKIKFEIAGDLVTYGVVDNNDVEAVKRFRFTSEPVWMFIENKYMVNFMFGANCPEFKLLLLNEIQRVKEQRPPLWSCPPDHRGPDEESRWAIEEAIRLDLLKKEEAEAEEKKRLRHQAYVEQMMFELCEETAIMILPWVFVNESGENVNKERVAAYSELRNEIFLECFDIEQEKEFFTFKTITFDEDVNVNQSNPEFDPFDLDLLHFVVDPSKVNDKWIKLFKGKCLVMRLKGRPPHETWLTAYPNVCPEDIVNCPVRVVNDVEKYLEFIIKNEPPPLVSGNAVRRSFDQPYWERYFFEDEEKTYPAVWFPPNAEFKIEFFDKIFPEYMKSSHHYNEPKPPLLLCAFKYQAEIFDTLRETCVNFEMAIKKIGVFEYDRPPLARRYVSTVQDFIDKVQVKTGKEIMVVVISRVDEATFLSFAGIGPYFISEDQGEIEDIKSQYFPSLAIDILVDLDDEEEEDVIDEEYFDNFLEEKEFYEFDGGELGFEGTEQ